MKKFLSLLLTLCMIIHILTVPAAAATVNGGVCGENLTWTLDTAGRFTISGTGAMTDYTAKTTPWYTSILDITSVVIEDGVTHIGDYAFYDADNLASVDLGSTIATIGNSAFRAECDFESILIPESVVSIGDYAFESCGYLTNIRIPAATTYIGTLALFNHYLTDITVDSDNPAYSATDGVLFNKNKTILLQYPAGKEDASYTIPDGVMHINNYAFYFAAITSISIPETVVSIGKSAFDACLALKEVPIPDSVTYIGDSAFSRCQDLEEIVLPDGITAISQFMFSDCNDLASVYIPDSVTAIGDFAFQNCSFLSNLNLPAHLESIGDYAFASACSIADVPPSITLPDTLRSIGKFAFQHCNFSEITIPGTNTLIDEAAFAGCYSLTDITVNSSNLYHSAENGVLFNKDNTTLMQYPAGKTDTQYTIPDSVTAIGSYAFSYSNTSLTTVAISDSVTSIGFGAFSGSDITSIAIPISITSISYAAFDNCNALTDIYFAGTKQNWRRIVIGQKNTNLTGAAIHYNAQMPPYTKTTFSAGTFSIVPVSVPVGSNVILLCYKDEKMVCVNVHSYDGADIIEFTPDADYDWAKVLVLDTTDSIASPCGAETIEL